MIVPRPKFTLADRVALAVMAASVGTFLLELAWPHGLEAPTLAEQAANEVAEGAPDVVAVGPVTEYSSVSERPLFTSDRRPLIADTEPVLPVGPRIEFELTAIIITSATQIALLRSSITPVVQRVTLNQTIDGWALTEVTPNAVVLLRGAESVTVPLRPDLGSARAGQAARVASRGGRN